MNAALRNPITPWENELWTPDPLFFAGETVFCVASGPSLTQKVADKLKGRRVIVVNSSCLFLPWADVLFFTDSGWFDHSFRDDASSAIANERWRGRRRAEFVNQFPGLVVTMSRLAKRELDDPALGRDAPRVLRVKGLGDPTWPPRLPGMPKRPGFPPPGSPEIQQGRNSGNTAVSLAIAMGAACVVLIAYDCRLVDGREHCHNDYSGPRDLTLYEKEFQGAFKGWNEAALASGVKVINCTPGSAVTEFPFAVLDEVLACDPS